MHTLTVAGIQNVNAVNVCYVCCNRSIPYNI